MKVRLLPVLFIALLGACSQSEQPSPTVRLDGVYRPTDEGPIASIAFRDGADYALVPSGCADASCRESGTYRLDAAKQALLLEDGVTHATRAVTLEILKTSSGASLVRQSIVETGQDLGGDGQKLAENGEQPAKGGNGLVTAGNQPVQVVDQMVLSGQTLIRGE